MSAKTILTLLFLISLCVVAVLGIRALPQRGNADPAANAEILVAAAALPSGTLLRAKDVVWHPAAGTIEPSLILRPAGLGGNANPEIDQQARAEVFGAALRAAVKAGEPIRRFATVKPGDRDFLQVVLSPRARAIAIPVATGGASTGLLYPGDRVDVILTQTFKTDPTPTRRSVSETVVENLRVLAIDAADAKPTGAGNGFGRTVTLEVTPEQVEKINVATELGKLSLSLRNLSAADSLVGTSAANLITTPEIKPIWAGDVSPALGETIPPNKIIAAALPVIEIIRGTKTMAVKSQ
jgi:pilus assembly protein CpaB